MPFIKPWTSLLFLTVVGSRVTVSVTSFAFSCATGVTLPRSDGVGAVGPLLLSSYNDDDDQQQQQQPQQTVYLDPNLDDDRVTELFAWVSKSFRGDSRYDNLMLAMVAVFGVNLTEDSQPRVMARKALEDLRAGEGEGNDDPESRLMGASISLEQRERASLGAMGAGQWMGQYRTRPHALLDLRAHALKNGTVVAIDDVDSWARSLSRGCRKSIRRAKAARDVDFVVTDLPIVGGAPAPHSSLAHFRCVVEHEVRVIHTKNKYGDDDVDGFFDALAEAVSRYVGTTRMAGRVQEYRDARDGRVIAFAHEVRKGRTIRGQWFYATDDASRNFVWFHSVHDLVDRAVRHRHVDVVDLGPSGTDAFSDLKAKYGFVSVDDWPAVADYTGPFWYGDDDDEEADEFYADYDATDRRKGSVVEWLRAMGVA